MRTPWKIVLALATLAIAAPSLEAADTGGTGVIVVKVRIATDCGPVIEDDGPPYEASSAPFDADIRFRNRDSGERWVIRSGDDGRIRRRFPAGRYRILPGRPREDTYALSKDRAYLRLAAGEVERTTISYDNGCR
jgi:hypothetical protein